MRRKADNPVSLLQESNAHALILAYFEFSHLKHLFRQGWLKRGVSEERCESVAEHSFGVAVLSLLLVEASFPALDACKVVRLALIHDFGEIYAGDFIPEDKIHPAEKNRLERQSVSQVFSRLPRGEEYIRLWEEFEEGTSAEALFVRQVDRLEMAFQASVYEHQGYPNMQEFFDSAARGISDPQLVGLMQSLQELRNV